MDEQVDRKTEQDVRTYLSARLDRIPVGAAPRFGRARAGWLNRVVAVPILLALVAAAVVGGLALGDWREQRAGSSMPSASPGPTRASAQPTASASPVVTPPAATASSGARPDAQHGLVTFNSIRTESDERNLQQPPAFAESQLTQYDIAVAPDGSRVAMIRTSQTGQQLITFATLTPSDVTTAVDFAGSGEFVRSVVWAGDGSGSVIFVAEKQSRGEGGGDNLIVEYSALRSVDVATRQVREIARISGQNHSLFPLAWLPGRQLAAALEVRPLGPVANYLLIRNGALERTDPKVGGSISSFTASRDGQRIGAVNFLGAAGGTATGIRWWPIDQPAAARDIPGGAGEPWRIEFRPGTDEIGVQVGMSSQTTPPARFEIWTLAGQRRVVSDRVGFDRWRVDGTAAIAGTTLIDPETGATAQLPGGAFRVAATILF